MPLAIALLNVSNPTLGAMDALSRLSHDTDAEVAQNAVVALGAFRSDTPDHVPCQTNTTGMSKHGQVADTDLMCNLHTAGGPCHTGLRAVTKGQN